MAFLNYNGWRENRCPALCHPFNGRCVSSERRPILSSAGKQLWEEKWGKNFILHPHWRLEGQNSQLLWYADGESCRNTWEVCSLCRTTSCSVSEEKSEVLVEQLCSGLHSTISLCHQWLLKGKWIPSPRRSRNHYRQTTFPDLSPLNTFIS